MKKPNINFLEGKGREFSQAALETETQFQNWLEASDLTEQDLLEVLNSGDFQLTLNKETNKAVVYVHRGMELLAQPLIWVKESGILLSQFKVDAGLLLLLISSKCSSQSAKTKIKTFVRSNLRVK